jgi:diadenosine tetraphosphate (Ap4A) HIT family hydrolase
MPLTADDRIFCKIIDGAAPASVVYRDEKKL